jgi:Stage III sporulation protein AB (spore_III_AB).
MIRAEMEEVMQIAKTVGCILIILSSTLMGFYCSSELKSRIEDLKELRKIIMLLKGDIRYCNTPLPEAINAIAKRHDGNFKDFLVRVSKKLNERSGNTFSQIWKEAVENELHMTSLTKKDKYQMIKFGEHLGYLDKEMQLNTLDLYLVQLDEELRGLTSNVKEKTYLYNSLGIMAGIFISIVLA